MPSVIMYDLFITHAWFYSKGYNTLLRLLKEAPLFYFTNHSVPMHHPVSDLNTDEGRVKLIKKLDNQIKPVNCFIVTAGLYAKHKYWIEKEIEIAQKHKKPIIGLMPWNQKQTPEFIQDVALEIVGWNTCSIVKAIRKHSVNEKVIGDFSE